MGRWTRIHARGRMEAHLRVGRARHFGLAASDLRPRLASVLEAYGGRCSAKVPSVCIHWRFAQYKPFITNKLKYLCFVQLFP
jgi:hypothetical protein